MRSPVTAALMLLLLAATSAAPTLAAYNRKAAKAYEDGEAAAKAGDWAAARKAFEEALSIDDEEGRIRISGVKYAEYYPSLGLAQAALELGDRDAALAALARFDAIKSPGSTQQATAAALRSRLESAGPPPPAGGAGGSPPTPAAPSAAASGAQRALSEGDLAGARRLALSAPNDQAAQGVLAAVDALLAEKLTAARRDQTSGALAAAKTKLEEVLAADPANSAAADLLGSVRADADGAAQSLSDARAALAAGRLDRADELSRQAKARDRSLEGEVRKLESEIAAARKAPPAVAAAPEARRNEGRTLLAAARKDLDAGRLADARRQAGDALSADAGMRSDVEAVRAEITRRSGEADDALRRARGAAAGGRFAEARQLAAQAGRLDRGLEGDVARVTGDVDAGEARAQRLLVTIEAHLQSGASAAARTAVAELASAFPEHPQLSALRASVEGNGELVAGLNAYFRGDWAGSIEALTPLVAAHPGRGDLLAVLGCAHATRGLLAGAADEAGKSDLERARQLFAEARSANPELTLDARYFSPRIRALFDASSGS